MLLGLNRDLFLPSLAPAVKTFVRTKENKFAAKWNLLMQTFLPHSQAREACSAGFVTHVDEFLGGFGQILDNFKQFSRFDLGHGDTRNNFGGYRKLGHR